MKRMSGVFSKLKKEAVQQLKSLGQTAVVSLLVLLLVIGPAAPAFAQGETANRATGADGLMSTIAVIFNAAGSFARGEHAASRPIPERELSSALEALNEFNLAVLKDPRLATILDEIIAELLEGEGSPPASRIILNSSPPSSGIPGWSILWERLFPITCRMNASPPILNTCSALSLN